MTRSKPDGFRGSGSIDAAEEIALGILAAGRELRRSQRANREHARQFAYKNQEARDCFRALVLILSAPDVVSRAMAEQHGRTVIDRYLVEGGRSFDDVAALVRERMAKASLAPHPFVRSGESTHCRVYGCGLDEASPIHALALQGSRKEGTPNG